MPPALIKRANEILKQLEDSRDQPGDLNETGTVQSADLTNPVKKLSAPQLQLSIFDAHSATFDEIRKTLESTDINRLTPVEALIKLQEIKSLLQ